MSGVSQKQETPPSWLIHLCRWFWMQLYGWWSLIVGLVLNIIAGLFLYPISPFAYLTTVWIYQYKLLTVVGLLVFLCLTLFVGFISKFEATPSLWRRQQHYLQQVVLDHEYLKASGIPEIFFPPSIKLEEVFLSPEFVCERTPVGIDYPLRAEELPRWQRLFAQRRKRFPRDLLAERGKQVEIDLFWSQFSRDYPVAVVQGYPGMGKSTLMKRIALHMARRCLGRSDPRFTSLSPALVPLLIELKPYSDKLKAQKREKTLPIMNYIPQLLKERDWQGKDPWPFLRDCLQQGRCLILFDGLDETGSVEVRRQVAQAIRSFIRDQRNTPLKQKTFNRFIITSRVAGYSPEAFDETPLLDYRLAELREPLMHEFLTRWYDAVVKAQPAARDAEIRTRMQQLHRALKKHNPLFHLAENPLLLMLMAGMQKHGIHLPTERAELYDTITLTLLKYREQNKDLPPIDEDEAVRRLGPLAYQMQTTEAIADEQTVHQSLQATIEAERKRMRIVLPDSFREQEVVKEQVHAFLKLIRERSNLFVQRTGEDFSFFHKSFQEYFVARYLLIRIQQQRESEIQHVISLVRQQSDIWREPFLFAIGYQSLRGRDASIARDLLEGILNSCQQETDPAKRVSVFLLAAQSVIEAKSHIFEPALEEQILAGLLLCYQEAQQQERFPDCEEIERVLKTWLLMLSEETLSSSWLRAVCTTLQDCQQPGLQRATLTMLIMILDGTVYPQACYDALIPLLLAIAGLPALDSPAQPVALSQTVDYTVADLARITLSRMGKHGPAGRFLAAVRQHFQQEPEQLALLARYSLESQKLLTCCVPPMSNNLYQNYKKAVERWLLLLKRRQKQPHRAIQEDLEECLAIHRLLLACAEEVRYPTSIHLLAMLKVSQATPQQAWQKVWQTYLLDTLRSVTPSSSPTYQEIILLWTVLFSEKSEQKPLQEQLLTDYMQSASSRRRFVQRFFAIVVNEERGGSIRGGWRDFRYWRYLIVWSIWIYFSSWEYWRNLSIRGDWVDFRFLGYFQDLSDLRYFLDLRNLRYWRDFRDLLESLLSPETLEYTLQLLLTTQESEKVDLFTILLGRLFSTQEQGEIRRIVTVAWEEIKRTSKDQRELSRILLYILRHEPVRSNEEVAFLRQFAEEAATDQAIQQVILGALQRALPEENALSQLLAMSTSKNSQIALAAQKALQNWENSHQIDI